MKCWAGWITSWNQDFWEKYQQLQTCRWHHYNGKSEEELKSLLKRVKEESEKAGLKLNIQKTKIMASGPITSRQIDRKTMETVTDFILLGSRITAHGDCSHKIKTLLLGRKVMTNLDSILKRPVDTGSYCQSYSFSSSHVQMWELHHKEGWMPK